MGINITLFVQIFHFLFAYVLLDRIFFRMAVPIVRAEDRKIIALESEIAEQQVRIEGRIRYNEEDWHILQKRLQSECPRQAIGQKQAGSCEDMSQEPYAMGALNAVVDDLSQIVVERITRGE
jgi:hypothetical protein